MTDEKPSEDVIAELVETMEGADGVWAFVVRDVDGGEAEGAASVTRARTFRDDLTDDEKLEVAAHLLHMMTEAVGEISPSAMMKILAAGARKAGDAGEPDLDALAALLSEQDAAPDEEPDLGGMFR